MRKLDEKVKKLIKNSVDIMELEEAEPLPEQYDSLKDYEIAKSAWQVKFENKKIELENK